MAREKGWEVERSGWVREWDVGGGGRRRGDEWMLGCEGERGGEGQLESRAHLLQVVRFKTTFASYCRFVGNLVGVYS